MGQRHPSDPDPATIVRMQARFLPQLIISEHSPASSPEPSPIPVIYNSGGGPAPVKEGYGIRKARSIDQTLNDSVQQTRIPKKSTMTGASSGKDVGGQRDDSSEKARGMTHVASLMQRPQRGSNVSGIKAAFERTNRKATQSSSKISQSPPKRRELISEEELSCLKQELEKERARRVELEGQCANLDTKAHNLQEQLAQKDDFWREEMARKIQEARQDNRGPPQELHSYRTRARIGETQSNGLQRQLTDLKRSISKSTRVETMVTSDSTFKQEMISLAHEMQNWTVNNYRRAKINASAQELSSKLAGLVNNRQLERLEPLWAGWRPENKISVLQATVAAMVMDIFDDQLLFGLPPQAEWAASLRKTAFQLSKVLEPQQYNKWRATTFDTVRQAGAMSAAADSAARTMAEYITTTLDALTVQPNSDGKFSSLQPIVRRAITLAHLFRVQRARFNIELPVPLQAFNPDIMENIAFDRGAEDGNAIDCATFPAVLKLGDEHGENAQWQNVILKANVVCGET